MTPMIEPEGTACLEFHKGLAIAHLLWKKAISLCDEDDEDIQRYENLIFIHTAANESCSWDYNITDWGKSWHKEWKLTDEAKNVRRGLIHVIMKQK